MTIWNKYEDENGVEQIEKIDDSGKKSYVPQDAANLDFQEYLKSLDNG